MQGLVVVLLIAAAIGFRFLPWQAKLVAAGVVLLALLLLRGKIFAWLFSLPFKAKGKVLRQAEVEVHSVNPGITPDEAEQDEGDKLRSERRYFALDATIKPRPNPGGSFQFWELGELALVAEDEDIMNGDATDACRIYRSRYVTEAAAKKSGDEESDDDAGDKVSGPHRVKFLIGVKPGITKLRFQYYFEKFGEVKLPV